MVKISEISHISVPKDPKKRFSKVTKRVSKVKKPWTRPLAQKSALKEISHKTGTTQNGTKQNVSVLSSGVKFGNKNIKNKKKYIGKEANVASENEVINKEKRKNKSKRNKKRKHEEPPVDEKKEATPVVRHSDDPIPKKTKWINKQRVLIFGCRGISSRDRHLMKDMRTLMPHSRPENKMERRENLQVVNDICQMKHCNKCVLFEGRGGRDVYMWLSSIPEGPSVKFLLQNIYTMDELRFTGNCLIGSRPLLSFDETFENVLHYRLIKELLVQTFGTPNHQPKSQPFFDHVFSFSVVDNRVWFRNYQILSEDGALTEIGPRFIMNPVKIFESSFGGRTLWENPHYVTPARLRQLVRRAASGKYENKLKQKVEYESKKGQQGISYELFANDEVFTGNPWERAQELVSKSTAVGGKLKDQVKKKLKVSQKGNKQTTATAGKFVMQKNDKPKSKKLNRNKQRTSVGSQLGLQTNKKQRQLKESGLNTSDGLAVLEKKKRIRIKKFNRNVQNNASDGKLMSQDKNKLMKFKKNKQKSQKVKRVQKLKKEK